MVDKCKKLADISFFTVITEYRGREAIKHIVAVPVCVQHYLEQFTLHDAIPLTEQGRKTLQGQISYGS